MRPDGHYDVVEASRDYAYVTREVNDDDLARRGWLFRGFGDVLGTNRRDAVPVK